MFNNIWKWMKNTGSTILQELGLVAHETFDQAVTDMDNIVRQYMPVALQAVQAAATSDLTSAEKRSQAASTLTTALVNAGYSAEKAGFDALVNLLVESGVTLLKLISGTAATSLDQAAAAAKQQ